MEGGAWAAWMGGMMGGAMGGMGEALGGALGGGEHGGGALGGAMGGEGPGGPGGLIQEIQGMDLKMAAAENLKNLKKINYSKKDIRF